jgi:hypothetical protein
MLSGTSVSCPENLMELGSILKLTHMSESRDLGGLMHR